MKTLFLLLFSLILSSNILSQNKFDFSFSERIRLVHWDNAIHLGDPDISNPENTFTRLRSSLSGNWFPNANLEIVVKLTNEFRYYFKPDINNFHFNEIIFDQLYIKWNNSNGILTLGRQNIILGEGFVVLDGSPLDGSRAIYFNAMRYDWIINKSSILTGFFVYSPKIDDVLPTFNGNDIDASFQGNGSYKLVEQTSRGLGLYYNKQFSNSNLQTYYIYKNASSENNLASLKLHTIGGRIKHSINEQFSVASEFAYQFGKSANNNKNSFGGYLYGNINLNNTTIFLPKTITLGSIFLSGDDPSNADDQGWDPLFSRWPKWSESYIYAQIREFGGKVAYWNNIYSFYATLNFKFSNSAAGILSYYNMNAFHNYLSPVTTNADGKKRGDLFIAKLMLKINKYLSGHILWEHFTPGNYYFDKAKSYNWARFELMFKI